MEEGIEKPTGPNYAEKSDFLSKVVRAGKRTYFFDLKTTRRNDFYLTITESKKRIDRDGRPFYEKHKIFLYNEDFDSFTEGLTQMIEYIRSVKPEDLNLQQFASHDDAAVVEKVFEEEPELEEAMIAGYADVDFDELGKK